MANSMDPDQTASIGAVCSWSMLFASILDSSVILGSYLQQMTSADDISDAFLLGALRFKLECHGESLHQENGWKTAKLLSQHQQSVGTINTISQKQ